MTITIWTAAILLDDWATITLTMTLCDDDNYLGGRNTSAAIIQWLLFSCGDDFM